MLGRAMLLSRSVRAARGAFHLLLPCAARAARAAPACLVRATVRTLPAISVVELDGTARPGLLAILGLAGLTAAAIGQPSLCMEDSSDDEMEHCVRAGPGYIVSDAIRNKYGKYPPWCRLNVDQVPLPFVNDMDCTYEQRGATRVTINQGGPSLSKRQATGQLCFRPAVPPPAGCTNAEARKLYDQYLQEQPAPCVIFRGAGNITQAEIDAYPEGLQVLFQGKAWVDRPIAVEWVEDVMIPFIKAERKAGIMTDNTRYMLFQDNLDAQKQPAYLDLLKKWGIDDHKVPPNETDQVQPVDRGLGRHVKMYLGQLMDEWMDDDGNLAKWEDNKLTASDRRILLGTWFYKATNRALVGEAKFKYFQHSGCLITADGTDDDLIKFEGTPPGYKVVVEKIY